MVQRIVGDFNFQKMIGEVMDISDQIRSHTRDMDFCHSNEINETNKTILPT